MGRSRPVGIAPDRIRPTRERPFLPLSVGPNTEDDLCGLVIVGKGMNNRRSIRKPGHDYAAPGHNFVTLCVRNRDPLLGKIDDETMVLSEMGLVVREEWQGMPQRFPMVRLDVFTIMPNHIRGIITIVGAPLAGARPVDQPNGVDRADSEATRFGSPTVRAGASPAPTLGPIIGAFKSLSDRRCRQVAIGAHPEHRFGRLWQRNYHDHVVADDDELQRIRAYIGGNVSTWRDDPDYVPTDSEITDPNQRLHLTSCSARRK